MVFMTVAAHAVIADDRGDEQMLEAIWRSPGDVASSFTEAVPIGQVESIIADLKSRCGEIQTVHRGTSSEQYDLRSDRCEVPARLYRNAEGKVTGLWYGNAVRRNVTLADLLDEIKSFDGSVSYAIYQDGDLIASHDIDHPIAVASAFKLVVLAALRDMIERGDAQWSDVVMLKSEHRSLPSGELQRMPVGSPLTLHTLAAKMIADSDNTATDVLIDFLGRGRLETLSGLKPFLTTKEMFLLKADLQLYKRYAQASLDKRYSMLESLAGRWRPRTEEVILPWREHAQWLMSTEALCSWIEKVADLELMQINPGVLDQADWRNIAYKGGNDTGVLNFTTLVHDNRNRRFCVSMTWNAEQPIDRDPLAELYGSIFRVLHERSLSQDRQPSKKTAALDVASEDLPLVIPPMRHGDLVNSAVFSKDDSKILTASDDGTARLYHATTGKELIPTIRHRDEILTAVFSQDESKVLTSSFDGTARLFDAATGEEIIPAMRHSGPVLSAAFSQGDNRIFTHSRDGAFHLFDATTGEELTLFSPDGIKVFSRDRSKILKSYPGKMVQLFDAATGKELIPPVHHDDSVSGAVFSGDESKILSWSMDQTARLFDAATGEELIPPMHSNSIIKSAVFSQDDSKILAWFLSTVQLFDAATGEELIPPMHHEGWVTEAKFSNDGSKILTSSEDETARLFDAATGKELIPPMRHESEVTGAIFSQDESKILSWSNDGTARVFDAVTGEELIPPMRHERWVMGAAFSQDESKILTRSADGTAKLWDVSELQ